VTVQGFWGSQLVMIGLASPIFGIAVWLWKDGGVRWWLRCGPWRARSRCMGAEARRVRLAGGNGGVAWRARLAVEA
jgi:hypothetical protein